MLHEATIEGAFSPAGAAQPGPSSGKTRTSHAFFHLALIAVFTVIHTAVHYAGLFPVVGEAVEHLPYFSLHVLHEAEYLGVIAYASWVFGGRGGAAALMVTAVASLPFIFASRISPEHAEYGFEGPGNSAIETAALLVVGGFIVLVNHRWSKERDQKELTLVQLQSTNEELSSTVRRLSDMQERLIQQERLSALGSMASGLAHDLRNALNPVLGFSELALEELSKKPEENAEGRRKAEQFVGCVLKAGASASEMLFRLREFYKRDAPQSSALVKVNEVIRQTMLMAEPKRKSCELETGNRLDVTAELTPVPMIMASAVELGQAVTNLLFNALDAMPNGGTVTVRTRYRAPNVSVEVSDNGIGMSGEVLRHSLEPFFTTKGRNGTGLGLSMVHGVVRRHGGTMSIESEPGRGTTVTLCFPVNGAGPGAGEEAMDETG